MVNRKLLLVASAAVFAVLAAPGAGASSTVDKLTYMTFSQPVQLPGVSLGSGTYIFEIANPSAGADIVRVMSRDRSIAYFMGFTRPVRRPHSLPRTQAVSLGEAAAGVAPPVTVWWPQNESTGRQFVYPRTH